MNRYGAGLGSGSFGMNNPYAYAMAAPMLRGITVSPGVAKQGDAALINPRPGVDYGVGASLMFDRPFINRYFLDYGVSSPEFLDQSQNPSRFFLDYGLGQPAFNNQFPSRG